MSAQSNRHRATHDVARRITAFVAKRCRDRSRAGVNLLLSGFAIALAVALACSGGGGVNTQVTFRAVLVEPPEFSIGRGCGNGSTCFDTVRVTFNRAIDTTAVLDTGKPRYFLATLSGSGFILDSLGTTVTNEMRTLVIPFQFVSSATYTFTLLQAQDQDGNRLENTAQTTFTMGDCTSPCP